MKNEHSPSEDPIWLQSAELLSAETVECLPVIGSSQVSSILENLEQSGSETNNQNLDLIILPSTDFKHTAENPLSLHDNYIVLNESGNAKRLQSDYTKRKKDDYEDMLYFVCNMCPFLCTEDTKIAEHLENAHINNTSVKLPELKCPACPNIFYHKISLRSHLIHDHGVANSDLSQIIQAVIYYSQKSKTKEKEDQLKEQNRIAEIVKKALEPQSTSSFEADGIERGLKISTTFTCQILTL
ncbi:uncharacterized protein [Leptinotarsa decemlineata]|uniref:uncharacterized protein n=1 Tax=Leptinotarsa decemlineata TaxID=7539 RepID=UPI003D308E18